MLSEIRRRSRSTFSTRTFTFWPTWTTDVPSPRQILLGVVRVLLRLREDERGERFEPALARLRRPGLSLLLVREVEVLELRLRAGGLDLLLQGLVEGALGLDGGEDRGAPLLQVDQVAPAFLDRPDLDLVQAAGGLLPITADEGDRVVVAQKVDDGRDARGREGQVRGDAGREVHLRSGARRRAAGLPATRADRGSRPVGDTNRTDLRGRGCR